MTEWSDEEATAEAEMHEGAILDVPASDYTWTYVKAFPISKVVAEGGGGDPDEWIEWVESEDAMRRDEDLGAVLGSTDSLESVFLEDPTRMPVVVSEEREGYVLWDGHHRTGIAHKLGFKTIPAIVGTRKRENNPEELSQLKRRLMR